MFVYDTDTHDVVSPSGAKVQPEIYEAFHSIYPILKRFEKQPLLVTEPLLVMGLLNARSMKPKQVQINDIIGNHQCDILAITETWLENSLDIEFCPGFSFRHMPRLTHGGGVGILFQNEFSCNILKHESSIVEVLCVQLSLPRSNSPRKFNVWVIYGPPDSSGVYVSAEAYYDKLESLFTEAFTHSSTPTVFVGDFNIRSRNRTSSLSRLLQNLQLVQRVCSPTRGKQTLDLVIHRQGDQLVPVDAVNVFPTVHCFDHNLVKLILKVPS